MRQTDGGSQFDAEVEAACRELGLPLFVLLPKCPKLNGKVERSHRTHEEEFDQCSSGDLTIAALQPALRAWAAIYNTVRPHRALGHLTPARWLAQWQVQHENETARAQSRAASPPV